MLKWLVKQGRAFILSLEDADATTHPATGREYADVRKFKRALTLAAKTVALLALMVLPARAWEFRQNPDRFPSVGLTVLNTKLDARRDGIDVNNMGEQILLNKDRGNGDESEIGADVRLPVTESVTFTFLYSHVNQTYDLTRPAYFTGQTIYREHGDWSGNRYGFNVRLYLNK